VLQGKRRGIDIIFIKDWTAAGQDDRKVIVHQLRIAIEYNTMHLPKISNTTHPKNSSPNLKNH
jgi:hypothetical protein